MRVRPLAWGWVLVLTVAVLAALDVAAQQAPTPRSPKAAAPFDPSGYWVPLITEDWRFRMVTPQKGDYASVPISNEGRRVADTWDLAKDEASGNQCKAYGVGGIARQPGRLHITWENDSTLKMEFDAGQQTRFLHFDSAQPPSAEKTWQGYSVAEWDVPPVAGRGGGGGGGGGAGGGGRAAGPALPPRGALKITTTNMREGYLRKNGVPYSENAVISEYIDRLGPEPDGAVYLLLRTSVDDPKYLAQPFVTSTHFRQEPDGSKWHPTPCKTDPPARVK
jgi:hypothetical protein